MTVKQRINVLLIEDNLEIARLIGEMLRKSPACRFEVKHESALKPALEYARTANIDIIVLDLTLPDSTGLATFVSAHTAVPQVPIVILTGVDDENLAVKAVREGAQDYLVKSHIDMHLFLRAIEYALERHRLSEACRLATVELEQRVKERTEELTFANAELQKQIDERIQAQSQLVQAAKMEVVGRLASGVAHEVRNPLAIILQAMEYLKGIVDPKDENAAATFRSMAKALDRADTIINGLLDFSRLSQLDMQPADMNSVLESSMLLVKYQCDRFHVRLVKELAPDLPQIKLEKN